METINLAISAIYDRQINMGMNRVFEIQLDSVKTKSPKRPPFNKTRAMLTKGSKVLKVMNGKGKFVSIESLKKGDVIRAIIETA